MGKVNLMIMMKRSGMTLAQCIGAYLLTSLVTPTNLEVFFCSREISIVKGSKLLCSSASSGSKTAVPVIQREKVGIYLITNILLDHVITFQGDLPSIIFDPSITTPLNFFFLFPLNGHFSKFVPSLKTTSSMRPAELRLYSKTRSESMIKSTKSSALVFTIPWDRNAGMSDP